MVGHANPRVALAVSAGGMLYYGAKWWFTPTAWQRAGRLLRGGMTDPDFKPGSLTAYARAISAPDVAIEAAQHVRMRYPRMARTAANLLVAEAEVLKYLRGRDVRNHDIVRASTIATELCFIVTAADEEAAKIAAAMRREFGVHGGAPQ
jgi:hypothetical protein